MGISVSFYNKNIQSEYTHVSYSTMFTLLNKLGFSFGTNEYDVTLPAVKVLQSLERLVAREKARATHLAPIFGVTVQQLLDEDFQFRVARQLLQQYNELRREGHKPKYFGGA